MDLAGRRNDSGLGERRFADLLGGQAAQPAEVAAAQVADHAKLTGDKLAALARLGLEWAAEEGAAR